MGVIYLGVVLISGHIVLKGISFGSQIIIETSFQEESGAGDILFPGNIVESILYGDIMLSKGYSAREIVFFVYCGEHTVVKSVRAYCCQGCQEHNIVKDVKSILLSRLSRSNCSQSCQEPTLIKACSC